MIIVLPIYINYNYIQYSNLKIYLRKLLKNEKNNLIMLRKIT